MIQNYQDISSPFQHQFPPHLSDRRQIKISACAVSMADLKKLYNTLSEKVVESANYEIMDKGVTSDELEKEIKDSYGIFVNIIGKDYIITGKDDKIFEQIILSNDILSISFDSAAYYRSNTNDKEPFNRLFIYLDFNKINLLDRNTPVYHSLANYSYIEVAGNNETWVNGVYEITRGFFQARRKKRNWLYNKNIFDVLLFLIGLPISLWLLFRINRLTKDWFLTWPITLEIALYVYIVVLLLRIMIFFYDYTRWLYPLIEYTDQPNEVSKKHRVFLGFIIISIFAMLAYDMIKMFFIK